MNSPPGPLFVNLPLPNPSPRREGLKQRYSISYPLLSWEKGARGKRQKRSNRG